MTTCLLLLGMIVSDPPADMLPLREPPADMLAVQTTRKVQRVELNGLWYDRRVLPDGRVELEYCKECNGGRVPVGRVVTHEEHQAIVAAGVVVGKAGVVLGTIIGPGPNPNYGPAVYRGPACYVSN